MRCQVGSEDRKRPEVVWKEVISSLKNGDNCRRSLGSCLVREEMSVSGQRWAVFNKGLTTRCKWCVIRKEPLMARALCFGLGLSNIYQLLKSTLSAINYSLCPFWLFATTYNTCIPSFNGGQATTCCSLWLQPSVYGLLILKRAVKQHGALSPTCESAVSFFLPQIHTIELLVTALATWYLPKHLYPTNKPQKINEKAF